MQICFSSLIPANTGWNFISSHRNGVLISRRKLLAFWQYQQFICAAVWVCCGEARAALDEHVLPMRLHFSGPSQPASQPASPRASFCRGGWCCMTCVTWNDTQAAAVGRENRTVWKTLPNAYDRIYTCIWLQLDPAPSSLIQFVCQVNGT